MKKIILLLFIALFSCNKENPIDPTVETITETVIDTKIVTVYTTNIVTINSTNFYSVTNILTNTINVPDQNIDFLIYENEIIYAMIGNYKYLWTNVKASYAGNNRIAISNVLYYFDNNCNVTNSKWLPTVPDLIAINGSDIWIVKKISAEYSLSQGGMYKEHSQIWKNNSIYSEWYNNQFEITDLFLTESTIIYRKPDNTFFDIENIKLNIFYANRDILIYNITYSPNSAIFKWDCNTSSCSWVYNYLGNSKGFLNCNNILYSANGYEIKNNNTLKETTNALKIFNTPVSGQQQIITSLATRFENGEYCTYWLNCNTGKVYRHIPSLDNLSITATLFNGDGTAGTGLIIYRELDVYFIDDTVYYNYNGSRFGFNFSQSFLLGNNVKIWN